MNNGKLTFSLQDYIQLLKFVFIRAYVMNLFGLWSNMQYATIVQFTRFERLVKLISKM